jgi:hypothetical protein
VQTRPQALRMVFATLWEAQANVEQGLRSVTSEHLRGAMRGSNATFKKKHEAPKRHYQLRPHKLAPRT